MKASIARRISAFVLLAFVATATPTLAAPRNAPAKSGYKKPARAKTAPRKKAIKKRSTRKQSPGFTSKTPSRKGQAFGKQGAKFTPGKKAPSRKGSSFAPTKQWSGKKFPAKTGAWKAPKSKPTVTTTRTSTRSPGAGSTVTKATKVSYKNVPKKAPTKRVKPAKP